METTSVQGEPGASELLLLLVTVLLNTMGIMIVGPAVPFLVRQYVSDPGQLAAAVAWLTSAYAICQFLAAPGLGALSDRFGRRPILLLCLLGSAVGYVIFGVGGALWVLFLGRIVDGITGANFSILFAYIADRTPPERRAVLFGRVGAMAGVGFLLGPAIGGFAAQWGYAMPAYLAAAVSLAAMVWGLFVMPESLPLERRTASVPLSALNPFSQLRQILGVRQLRWLLAVSFCYMFPFAGLQATFGVYIIGLMRWSPVQLGLSSLMIGGMDMLVQGVIVARLLPRLGEARTAAVGLVGVAAGYLTIAVVSAAPSAPLLLLGIALFAGSGGLVEPSLSGLISRAAGDRAQGAVQGGGQALQSVALMIGPLWAGWIYAQSSPAAPFWSGALWMVLGLLALAIAAAALTRHAPSDRPVATG